MVDVFLQVFSKELCLNHLFLFPDFYPLLEVLGGLYARDLRNLLVRKAIRWAHLKVSQLVQAIAASRMANVYHCCFIGREEKGGLATMYWALADTALVLPRYPVHHAYYNRFVRGSV